MRDPSPPETTSGDVAGWRIEILAGPHAGAVLPLPSGAFRLGGGAEDDLVLADPGARPGHALLTLGSDGEARLAAGAEVTAGGRRVAAGGEKRLATGSEIALGATRLRLTGPARAKRPRGWLRPAALAAGGAALLAAGFVWLQPTNSAAVAVPVPQSAPPARMASRDPATAAAALQARMDEAGLPLTAEPAGGAVRVAGVLPPGAEPRWAALRNWYDGAHGAGPALLVHLGAAIPAELPRLAVRAVSLAPIPFVIAADGERYGEGAVLPGGWVLDAITPERLTFRRGDRTVTTDL
jgi:hypothetical protein